MARTSPCFYIAPTAISITPNANGSANDLAVNVVKGAKVRVYSQGISALGCSDASYQQWTFAGRNRRLADSTKPYSIYARLAKNNKEDGYLVFAPKVADGEEWLDKYAYVTISGLATGTANKNNDNYWYLKLGDVSLPADNARTVTLDTGILGTDRFNTEWNLDPDQMPLRIEIAATIESKDAGDNPYVEWGKELTLQAKLFEGWANANVQNFHHFTIQRNSGDTTADTTYNFPNEDSDSKKPSSGRQMPNGNIVLSHVRGTGDAFNGAVSSTWTVIAWGMKTDATDSTSSSGTSSSSSVTSKSASSNSTSSSSSSAKDATASDDYEKLAEKSINITAETVAQAQYTLEASPSYIRLDADGSIDRSNQYADDKYLLVNGYKIVGGKRHDGWGDKGDCISVQIVFNGGMAWYESTYEIYADGSGTTLDNVCTDFEPTMTDSYSSIIEEMGKNGLKSCKAIMYEGENLDPDKIPSDKVLATLDIPIVRDGADGTSHNVSLTMEKRTVSGVEEECLVVTFTKSGTDGVTTTNNVQEVGGYAQLYIDGTLNDAATSRLNLGTTDAGELTKSAFPQVFSASYITVKWYDKEGGTLIGMTSLTRGADGASAVTYGVQVSPYYEWVGSGRQPGLQFKFVKTVGAVVSTYTDVTNIGCTVKVYGDGVYYANVSEWINEGHDAHFIYSTFPYNDDTSQPTLADKSVIAVEMYLDSTLVATANLSNGKQGKGALEISVNPDTVVFDTDDNGLVASGTSKTATIGCYRDGELVKNVEYSLTSSGHPDCNASIETLSSGKATVTISGIATQTVDGVTVSKTAGTVEVQVYDKDNGRYYFPVVKFAVSLAMFASSMKADNKKFETVYNELTNNGDSTDLSWYESKIKQTAREISLTVSEKKAGRRNLLVGSAFRKQGEGCIFMGSAISINTGYEGVNSIRAENTYTGTTNYYGAFWDGSQGGSSVKITRGKKYTLSAWVKCSDSRAIISLETIYTDGQTGANRGPRPKTGTCEFSVSAVNTWQLLKVTIDTSLQDDDTSNTQYDYMAVNIFSRHTVSGLTVRTYICRPMLEEGDEYNGWTLSEQDYDYVGGNLLDNAGTMTQSGNVETLDGTVTQGGMGESASIKGTLPATTEYVDFLQYSTSGMGLKAGEDYVLSFYAKASGEATAGRVRCFLYPSSGNINIEDSEAGNENTYQSTDGSMKYGIVAGTGWKRYWVHWRPTVNDPAHVLFRLLPRGEVKGAYSSTTTYAVDEVVTYGSAYWRCVKAGKGNTPSSSSSYWDATTYDVSIAQPKLEVGATMTEWTEKRSDMVDKAALLATGIDIASKKITLTADNTKFQDNDGNELAVIDTEGLRASKIATTDNGSGHTVMSGNTTVWYQKDGKTPGIAVFYDAAGVPHFQFYGTDGSVKYDFGPSGLQSFINSTQSAYSDECYLHNASSYVSTSGDTITGMDWCYVAKNASADLCYIYRKQIPTTDESSASAIYDGCVFKGRKYSGTYWPSSDTDVGNYLLPNGWYVLPNDGNLPTKLHLAEEEAVYDPTETVYYQDFYYYSSGKITRHVKAYMKKVSNTLATKFKSTGKWDEV